MLIRGDARHLPIRSESVQCVVTSPPYWGLRDYGTSGQIGLESSPDEYVGQIVDVFREIRRVLRKDGTVWLNLGDSYGSGNSGLTSRDWANGTIGGNGNSYRQPSSRANPGKSPIRGMSKQLLGIPWKVAFALQEDGWILRSDIIWAKPNPMPESVTDRPTKSHEYVFLLSKSERYFYDQDAIREESIDGYRTNPNNSARPDRKAKSSSMWRNVGTATEEVYRGGDQTNHSCNETWRRNCRSVWTISTESYSEAHFATFPRKLIEPMILAGSRPGDIVFDPFVGSGTTVHVARGLGRRGLGMDLKYFDLSTSRIYGPLFASTINS